MRYPAINHGWSVYHFSCVIVCMCACVCTYVCVCVYSYIHIYIYMHHIHVCMWVCIYPYGCIFDLQNLEFDICKSLLTIVSCCDIKYQQWVLLLNLTLVSTNIPISILISSSLSMLWGERSCLYFYGICYSPTHAKYHIYVALGFYT